MPLRVRLRQMGCNLAGKNAPPCTWTLRTRISATCWQLIHKGAEMDHSGMRWLGATGKGECKRNQCFQKGLERAVPGDEDSLRPWDCA